MKMFKFVVFALVAILLVAVRASPVQSRTNFIVIPLEEACVLQGGICLRNNECEPDNLVLSGARLCPNQHHLGVQCCYL